MYNQAGAGKKIFKGYSWMAPPSILLLFFSLTPKLGIVTIKQAAQ